MFGEPDNPPEVPVAFPVNAPTNPPVDVVTPETFSADICPVHIVQAEDTLTSSKVVSPSTSKLSFLVQQYYFQKLIHLKHLN